MQYLPVLLLLVCNQSLAERVRWQDYDIHYTTFTSSLVPAEVAGVHGIVRSDQRIVTNIVILQNGRPIAARIKGSATNLLNQLFDLNFVEVKEQDAIYYLASQIIDQRDTIRFAIDVTPVNSSETYSFKFTRQYYKGAQ
ncbi:MAG: DUF4426 domain-containing protein [Pseudomonadales bacterium]